MRCFYHQCTDFYVWKSHQKGQGLVWMVCRLNCGNDDGFMGCNDGCTLEMVLCLMNSFIDGFRKVLSNCRWEKYI